MFTASRVAWVSLSLLLIAACGEIGDGSSGSGSGSEAGTGGGSATGTGGASATGGSSGAGATTGGAAGGGGTAVDECPSRPAGTWSACKVGGLVDNKLCGADGGAAVSCLSPASGNFNVCGIEGCVDDCDCFAPPATGDAVVFCAAILGNGDKACALYCAGGQTCPDGMQCQAGYCYWPD